MGSIVDLTEASGRAAATRPAASAAGHRTDWLLAATAVLAPLVCTLLLVPWRHRLAAADSALILVVVIVAVATSGRRWAAALCALAAALSFDFFLTRPYQSFRITRSADVTTEVLLLVVGLAVGELAARGRHHRASARAREGHLAVLHSVTELAASGGVPEDVARAASDELRRLLTLRSCTFVADAPDIPARLLPDGEIRIGDVAWSTGELGLPHRGVDLPVRAGGAVVGHFILEPVPGVPVPRESLQVAVTIAEQVGAALAAAHEPAASRR